MPKKKRSGTQKKSKPVPDTVVLLPDALLKKYKKNLNRNKNVNVNIIQNKISVSAPKKVRRRTARAVKSGPVRMQGPGMLFSSPPVTIQSDRYGAPPYPVQPVRSQPVIPGVYRDPDRHRISIESDNKASPIVSNVNPSNLEPMNKQARLVPTGITAPNPISIDDYNTMVQSAQDITRGMDRVLANINPFGGLNKVRSDLLPMASNLSEDNSSSDDSSEASVENYFSDSDPGMDIFNERWLGTKLSVPDIASQPAVSSVPEGLISETVYPYMLGNREIPETVRFRLTPGGKLPPKPEGYTYQPPMEGQPSIVLQSGKRIAATIMGEPKYRKIPGKL